MTADWIPNIIGLERYQSDDACMPLDQSAVNAAWLLHACICSAHQRIRAMGSVSALASLRFFLPCNKAKFKGQFKILVQ